MKLKSVLPSLTFLLLAPAMELHAAPFASGNLVIHRVGSGSGSLLNTGNPVFLDEYNTTGTLVQSIALPTTVSGANKRLVSSGTATSEGLLTRSADGQFLVLAGYDATPPVTGLAGTTAATVNRVIGRVNAAGTVDTSTALTDYASANNPRSAVSSDGSKFWLSGGNGGVRIATLGATTSTDVSTTVTNLRQLGIAGGQLYVTTSSGTAVRLGTVGTGLPETTGQTITNLTGIPTTGSPYAFFFADLDAGVAGVDTVYIADDTNTTGIGGVRKFSLVGGTWTANGIAGAFGDAYRGLTGSVNAGTVTLYATRKGGSAAAGGGELVSLVDATGYNATMTATPTLLATAAANTAFRGVALAPAEIPQLILTEINSNGTGGDFWELTNVGVTTQNIGNWKWIDNAASGIADPATVTIPAGTVIAPGESIIFSLADDAAAFRSFWGALTGVQIIATPTGPGLGQNDAVNLFNASGTNVLSFTYASGGFTKSDGSAAAGGHAGASAGGTATHSAVIDQAFGTGSGRRYKAAAAGVNGGYANTSGGNNIGSPGATGLTFGSGPSITLSLSVAPASFSESATNPAATGTISRTTSGTSDLVVNLSSSDTTEATVPATVTILANQTSATFSVTAVNDTFPDGNKTATITASATDATTSTFDVTVQDDGDVLQNNLLLTEVLSQQTAAGVNDFWELTNISASPVSLAGYSWHDSGRSAAAASAYALPAGSSIAPGESVIFTTITPTAFRTWWGISNSVQVFQTVGAPGLGQNDGISFFDNGGNELFFFNYAAGGFTKVDGNPSTGTHAGPSAGAPTETQSVVWVPSSGTSSPRYTFATVNNLGGIASAANALDIGSPGVTVGNPTVSIGNAAIAEGNSATTTLALTVTRSDTATAFSVDYAVTGGTATSGTDYATLANGTLTFTAAGAATQSINITVNGDTTSEADETVIITLSNVVNTTGTTVIATANGTGTITNDDNISPQITTQPTGTTIATGYTATLSLVATGTPTPTIQWYQGSTGTTTTPVGTNSSSFTTPALTATTSYWARVTNGGGSVDSSTATVSVTTGPTAINLANYVRVARYNLPEYRRTALPAGTAAHNLLCDEASGVAYNWDTDTLFICGDGGRAITQVTKTGQLVDTMSLELNAGNPQGTEFYDPEGITYIGGGQFVFSEERERRLVKFTYAAGTTLTRAAAQTVDIGTFDDNTGTEGLSYDPQTSGFIVLKEKTPIGVFQTSVDFNAGTATNGSSTTVNSTNLFDTTLLGMTDVADVFAFSNIPSMTAQPQAGNLLIIGQENARILNVDRTNGSILSTLNITSDVGNPLSAADQQHEGITMDRAGLIYVVNENGGGSIEFPQLWVYAPSTVPNAAPTAVVLNNAVNSLQENISTASPIKVGDIVVTDDGLGTNTLSLTGADAASFQITGSALYLKSGVVLDFETKTSYAVTINADDTTVGATPDATVNYTLSVTDQVVETPAPPALIITEVAPWASSNGAVGGDWFEVTNVSANAVDITGWKIDDSSNAFATSLALTGITSIAAGESVIFLESTVANQATIVDTFKTVWFGGSPPVGLQVGTYQGSGAGLSTGGDAVNLFTAGGTRHSGVSFGAADVATPFQTFDNTAAANDTAIALLSTVGVNGAFIAATSAVEIGSPGISNPGVLRVTEVAPWSSGNSPVLADWFEVTNTGARAVDITGWKVDDSSESPAAALALVGITSIAPGESVIFLESATPVTTKAAFLSNWFGASPPATLQVGSYTGGGIGLSTGGDAVNLYDTNNVRQVNVSFGLSPSVAPFTSFDNATGLNVAAITTFSSVGVNGAFIAANSANEIGSPGAMASAPIGASAVSIAAASIAEGNSGTMTLNLPVTRTNTASVFTVNYAVTGGTATAGTDYVTLAAGTLSFAFNGAASQNIAITLNGDTTIESNETIIVTLSGIVNANGTTTLGTATANGTITNDDTVPVSFPASGSLTSTVKGSIDLDAAPLTGGAEIPAFDPVSKRAFTSSNTGIQVIDLTNPAAPAFVSTIAPATLGVSGLTSNDVSSVTVRKGAGANPSVLAAAIISTPKSTAGYVVFLNAATGALLGSAQVGAVPDHIAFTPDGTKLLVANEGEIDGTAVVISTDTTIGSVSIIPVDAAGAAGTISTADFTAYDTPATITSLKNAGVRIFQGGKPSTDFEPEYFAISPDGTKAMVTLQEANAVAVLDIATATFTSVTPLGKKNFATGRHDFSDRDGAGATALINPTTGSPVFGLYMPDAIASFSASGQTYYVTANEGDDRNDFLNPDETTTVSNAAYDLDNTVFPNEAALKNQASLGRLTVSNAPGLRGDTDNDGDIDEILSYGGRSFSILDSTGAIVFDSGDMIENIIASQFTANFDDGRSDNKGPEPEGVTIATLGARTYAFVGLERSHMALVFDVTNPAAVTFTGGLARAGDLNPEGLVVVSSSDSPSGKPLLLVASEVSQTLTVFELNQTTDYTLQVLHYYGESGLLGIQTAPIMGAMIDRFDDQYANTLVLAEGDSFIPGPWLIAGADPSLNAIAGIGSTALGRPDFAIMNAFGTDASALGNHEFDLGSPVLSGAFFPAAPWVGAQFPFITTNLNFAADSSLRGRADTTLGGTGGAIAGSETTAIKAKIAPYAVQTISGQKVGIVGSTTWDLLTKTSPNGTVPKDDANPATSDLQEVAAYLQGAITALQGLGVNKIILVDQLDTLQRNKDLAGLVSGIDIMVAGGGHERMGDANDVAVGFNGHDADFIADAYPIVTSAADGKPTLIVTTDTEFSYLGRLVVDFDSDGVLILPNLNTVINGAYASTEANLQAAYATASSASTIIAGSTIGTAVQNITNALNNIVVAKDSSVFGYTDVYLEGDRVFGRTQEVNQGNITADANAWKARTALGLGATDAVFSLKNGGGIRASLGSVLPDGTKVAPLANPITGKPAKGISQLDIENALRFDNKLMVFDTTPTGLLAILNFAAGLSGGPTVQSGGYPQVGNIRFSYNSALPTGQKVRSAAMVNEAGQITARIVENGAVLPGAPATIQCVSINFTANGGDGYPIKANADNFRYLLNDGSLSAPISEALDFTAAINVPANVLGEQKAFSDFLVARHPSLVTAYKVAETPVAQDTRIQQLAFRSDNVLNDPRVTNVTPAIGSISGGTSVTITGTNFTDATTVTFGGTNATSFTVDSATQITTTTPAHLAGAVSVLVTNPNGTNPANTLYTYAPPEIAVHNGSHSLATELSDGQVTAVDFGSTAPNTASVRSFLVRNTSAVDLKISSITVPSGYATTGAAATLAAGTSYGFQVSLDSATPATYTGNVVINNDDLDESAFDFPVTGTVVAAGSAPVVNLGENIAVQGSTGSAVLGGPAGSTLSKLIGSPAINSSGVLASAVQIRHANASIHTGMMSGQPLTLIATDTQTAVGMAVGVTYSIFNPPVINEAGHIAFTGEVRGPGITKGVNNRCLFSNASDGVLKLAAQIGMSTTLGSNLKTIGNFAIGGDLVIFLGTLVDNRVVLFGWDASTGLRPLVRTGQTLSTNGVMKTVKSFSILETGNASSGHGKEISVAPSGESLVTFSVIFTDNTQAVVVGSFDGTSDTGFGLTYGASQQLADTYAAPGVIPLAKWSSFRSPGFDNTGNYYGFISQMVTNTLAGVSSTNNVGVFVDTAPGVLTMQLRESNAAPGITAGVVFSDFSDLVLGGGDYEFLVKGEVRGSGVVTNVNDKGLWAQHATSGLMLVAREGSEAPGVSGSTFLRLTQIALPGTAQPIFEATMKTGTGGVTTANDTGLWVVNEAGEVKLAVREGDVINVGGTNRTVTAITALLSGLPTGGALGRRAFLEDGQITLLLTFSGGIQANAKVVVP